MRNLLLITVLILLVAGCDFSPAPGFATPTQETAPTPTDEVDICDVGWQWVTVAPMQGLRLRESPRLDGEIILVLEAGTQILLVDYHKADDYLWYQTDHETVSGWVAGLHEPSETYYVNYVCGGCPDNFECIPESSGVMPSVIFDCGEEGACG